MGLLDYLEDAADAVADAAGDVYDSAAEVVDVAATAVVDTAGAVYDGAGDAYYAVAEAVDDASEVVADVISSAPRVISDGLTALDDEAGGVFSGALGVLDDTLLDAVDYVTGGVIDIDYDDGTFSAAAGIEGLVRVSTSFGEDGYSADADTVLANLAASVNDVSGVSMSGSAGIDYGPLPYAEAHATFAPNGDLTINGRLQGTIPIEGIPITVNASGGIVLTDEVNALSYEAEVGMPVMDGIDLKVGAKGTFVSEADGDTSMSHSATIEGEFKDLVTVKVTAGMSHLEDDGTVVDQTRMEAGAAGFGVEATVGASTTRVTDDEGVDVTVSSVTGDVDWHAESAVDAVMQLSGADKAVKEALGKDAAAVLTGDSSYGKSLADRPGPIDPVKAGTADALDTVLKAVDPADRAAVQAAIDGSPLPDEPDAAVQPADDLAAPVATDSPMGAPYTDEMLSDDMSLDDLSADPMVSEGEHADEQYVDEAYTDTSSDEMVSYPEPTEPMFSEPEQVSTEFDQAIETADAVVDESAALFEDL
jgi:hypothetical protein